MVKTPGIRRKRAEQLDVAGKIDAQDAIHGRIADSPCMLHGHFRGVPHEDVDTTQRGKGMVGQVLGAFPVTQIDGVIADVVYLRMIHQPLRGLFEDPRAA